MSAFPGQPGHRELRDLLREPLIRRGLLLVAGGIACVVGAILVAYPFDALLPAEARFWGTFALAVLALGLFLLGAVSLVTARARWAE